jgi:hypothetical protein
LDGLDEIAATSRRGAAHALGKIPTSNARLGLGQDSKRLDDARSAFEGQGADVIAARGLVA